MSEFWKACSGLLMLMNLFGMLENRIVLTWPLTLSIFKIILTLPLLLKIITIIVKCLWKCCNKDVAKLWISLRILHLHKELLYFPHDLTCLDITDVICGSLTKNLFDLDFHQDGWNRDCMLHVPQNSPCPSMLYYPAPALSCFWKLWSCPVDY